MNYVYLLFEIFFLYNQERSFFKFQSPQRHPGWEEPLNCKKERKACAQYFLPVRFTEKYGYYGDEDCLTLSVHTPHLSVEDTKLPVIVFLMNEQFKVSYNVTKDYSPDFFMKENVIVVTVNHRLGALGFLSFEDDLLPGNNGLRDVILALKWLKDNIHYFAGDPDRITLMGNQGGATVVDALLHSSKAKGLFHRAILQSGTSWNSMYFGGKSRQRAQRLAEEVEWSASSSSSLLKNLANVPALILTEAELRIVHADEARENQRGIVPFSPIIEHDHPEAVLSKFPEESPIDIDIPVMIGYNSRESLEYCERFLDKPQYLTFADRDFLLLFPIRQNYHFKLNDNVYYAAVQEIKDFYFDEGYIKISKPGEYMTYINDILQFYSIDYTVRKYANESRSDVYYYTFDYGGEFNMRKNQILEQAVNLDGTWGASLTDELCYLFVCKPIKSVYLKALQDRDSEEMKVLRNMVKLWTNFAKYG